MAWLPILVLCFQAGLLLCFCFFASFNYIYGFAALRPRRIRRVKPSGRTVAVVVVSYNEKYVLPKTIESCCALTYPNKLVVLSDDSDDEEIVGELRALAESRGCRIVTGSIGSPLEIWESDAFVYFHRKTNIGYKGENLRQVAEYLKRRGIELMYLLDADWHPQPDAIERALEALEADPKLAFVQTKRITVEDRIRMFQKYVALSEEGCYYVDFEGRQTMGHPILFSGCCTLLRLDAVQSVGGFASGHLTEDLDVTNRLWLAGWKGQYCGDIINHGEVPFTYDDFRRQQQRWAFGTAQCLRDYLVRIIRCPHFRWIDKLAAIRQNAYFATSLLTSVAILQGMATVWWLISARGAFETEYYLYLVGKWRSPLILAIYLCVLSNFVEYFVMILFKRRRPSDLIHLPVGIWYAWSVLSSLVVGTVRGLLRMDMTWFRTPKYLRSHTAVLSKLPPLTRLVNAALCLALIVFYCIEGWAFGWRDPFALLLVPAFALAALE